MTLLKQNEKVRRVLRADIQTPRPPLKPLLSMNNTFMFLGIKIHHPNNLFRCVSSSLTRQITPLNQSVVACWNEHGTLFYRLYKRQKYESQRSSGIVNKRQWKSVYPHSFKQTFPYHIFQKITRFCTCSSSARSSCLKKVSNMKFAACSAVWLCMCISLSICLLNVLLSSRETRKTFGRHICH